MDSLPTVSTGWICATLCRTRFTRCTTLDGLNTLVYALFAEYCNTRKLQSYISFYISIKKCKLLLCNMFLTSTPQLLLLQGFYIHGFDARYE